MSDTSRKRSRKSKLVPRECAVDEELQVAARQVMKIVKQHARKEVRPEPTTSKTLEKCDTSVLKKINAPTKENTEPISPRKFEINIQVETCDEDNGSIYVSNDRSENSDENRLSPTNKDPHIIQTNKSKKIYLGLEKSCLTPISLSRDSILEAADNVLNSSTNVADKILNICVKNTIGFEVKQKLVKGWQESLIQEALDEWRTWQFRSFHRDSPLFYKCYVCNKSWWYLSDFRDHISNHTELIIGLEKYVTHEVNIVAYHLVKPNAVQDIFTGGLCYRCGKDFDVHKLSSRGLSKYYGVEGCRKQFYTCMGLRDHMSFCSQCQVEDKPLKCGICRCTFDTEDQLNDHLVLSHSVRSDVPIMVRYKTCKQCFERYSCKYSHTCAKRGPHSQCPQCFKSFSSKMSMEIHLESSYNSYICDVCDAELIWSCQKYEHMLFHTDNYMIVKRCISCDGLKVFVNNDDLQAHRLVDHEFRDSKHLNYFPNILVPTSCLYQIAESESALTEQESIPIKKESVPKEKGSISSEQGVEESNGKLVSESDQKSVPEIDQESIKEEQESATDYIMEDITIKEEPLDLVESPILVIKEEPIEEVGNQMHEANRIENFDHQINVKEEYIEEELDEYEGDIIKLNFDIEDLLVNQESKRESTNENLESDDDKSEESFPEPINIKQESILEPEVIIQSRKNKKLYRCTKCNYTAKHRQYREHIENDCRKTKVKHNNYSCTKCKTLFPSMKKYLAHFVEHDYKRLSCPECLKEFHTFTSLGQHVHGHIKQNFVRVKVITHTGRANSKPDYQCKKCKEIITLKDFFVHWELHINDRPHPVKPVKKTSRAPLQRQGEMSETGMKECLSRLHKQPKECNRCHRRFKRVYECKRHIIEHLLADAYSHKHIYKELKCQMCDSGFPNSEKYKEHMRHHASLPLYKCVICDKTFSDSSNFTKHKKVHNFNVIVCDLCGKKFQTKESLEKHIEKHKNTEPVICKICNKIFYFESSYRRHVRYFHERTTLGYRCIICSERFESLKLKWIHMWEVHKERKHKADCPICFQSFRKYSDVRAHARSVHSMEVSVYSVKNATKSLVDINKILKNSTEIKVGPVETLVVYDSDQ